MAPADRETFTILRKRPPKPSAMKTEQAINAARRQGVQVDTQQKWGAGQNKQHQTTKNTAKLDRETEELRHDKISLDVGKLIQQGRQAKGWSQKDLATRVNEKPQVINDYEAGRAIPNQNIIGKIEKAIGMKLRGKDRGTPLQPPGAGRKCALSVSQIAGEETLPLRSSRQDILFIAILVKKLISLLQ